MHTASEDDRWTALETKVISLFSWKHVTLFSWSFFFYFGLSTALSDTETSNSFKRKISFFILCLHNTKYMRKPNQKRWGFVLFPICWLSTNNPLIPPAGELHMLLSPASRDESCSAPALLAEGNLCMTAQPDVLHVNGCCRPEIWVQFTDVLFITMLKHNCISSWRPELYAKGQFSLYKLTCSYLSNETANSVTVKAFSIRGNHWEW